MKKEVTHKPKRDARVGIARKRLIADRFLNENWFMEEIAQDLRLMRQDVKNAIREYFNGEFTLKPRGKGKKA